MLDNTEALAKLQRIRVAIEEGGLEQPEEIAAWKCRTELIKLTPKKWTGLTRRNWAIARLLPRGSGFLLKNDSKVMLFLEEGTGKETGGYIYPKSKKALFIPLKSRAMMGWSENLKYGVDYILRKRVRGIKAMHIVEKFMPRAAEILGEEVNAFLQRVIK